MVSDFDFSAGIGLPITVDRVQRGERLHDGLPRRRYQIREKPGGKGSGDTSPEDTQTSDEKGTEKHRLDLEV
jgi:hypothetical protein